MQIWEEQLDINFNDPPASDTIKSDCGPHLSRLPEELLPAIGKFLIIAKDKVQNEVENQYPYVCPDPIIQLSSSPECGCQCAAERINVAGEMSDGYVSSL